ncbi:MAG: hypothetical protein IKZ44_10520 [Clostridia bacterium]|nr:hypothetical protein [Clostridia bacterium]
MDGMILKRMLRRPWLLLVSFLVSGALCLLLCLLIGYRDRQAEHLENVRNSYEIRAVVTDLRGTKSDKLFLSRRYTDFLRDEENGLGAYIKDLCLTKSFPASSPIGNGKATGVTGERCAEAMDTKMGGAWFSEVENFFESEERICLVPASVYDDYAGQTLIFNLTDEYALEGGSSDYPLRVVGWYKGDGINIYIPFPTSQTIAGHLAEAPSVDTASFIVKDNARVDEMLEIAYKKFRRVDPSSMETDFALTVYDKQYKATIASMEQNLRRTSLLLPLIALLGLGAGFLLGLLGTRGEVRTYALMRTLGMNGFGLFCSVMIEQLLAPLLAAAVVGLVFKRPAPTLIFFGCHLVGCALAVLRPVSVSPTRLLRDQE